MPVSEKERLAAEVAKRYSAFEEDIVGMGRKRIPDQVPWDAERLECLVFSGYDPYFEGDEPPGL